MGGGYGCKGKAGQGYQGYLKKGHKIKKIFEDILSQKLFLRGVEGVAGGGLF